MPKPIEFHFDFSSPYSYIASEQIESVAARHGRTVDYKPVLLGAVFKVPAGATDRAIRAEGKLRQARLRTIGALRRRAVSAAKPISDRERGGKARGRLAAATSARTRGALHSRGVPRLFRLRPRHFGRNRRRRHCTRCRNRSRHARGRRAAIRGQGPVKGAGRSCDQVASSVSQTIIVDGEASGETRIRKTSDAREGVFLG